MRSRCGALPLPLAAARSAAGKVRPQRRPGLELPARREEAAEAVRLQTVLVAPFSIVPPASDAALMEKASHIRNTCTHDNSFLLIFYDKYSRTQPIIATSVTILNRRLS
jgi:hypothetical protein